MATARKLPSGAYRVRCYIGTDSNGKKIRKSFTAPTKKEAEFLASQYMIYDHDEDTGLTFSQALKQYIDIKSEVLSPSTIKDYKNRASNDYKELNKRRLTDITQSDVQLAINNYAKTHSPKSCRNYASLIISTFKMYRPNYALNLTLPQKVQNDPALPSEDDIRLILDYFKAKEENMYIAVLLAVFAPLRRSEISALDSTDIEGNIIHVNKAMVIDENKKWQIKTTKTVAGDRFVELPDFIIDILKTKEGRIVTISPDNITSKFGRALKKLGVPHIKFHALRHYSASLQHSLGIPDEYIMKRGGWNSDTVLKQVYRHALSDEQKKANSIINTALESKFVNSGHDSGHENSQKPIK